jgi:hypothetical protein
VWARCSRDQLPKEPSVRRRRRRVKRVNVARTRLGSKRSYLTQDSIHILIEYISSDMVCMAPISDCTTSATAPLQQKPVILGAAGYERTNTGAIC